MMAYIQYGGWFLVSYTDLVDFVKGAYFFLIYHRTGPVIVLRFVMKIAT